MAYRSQLGSNLLDISISVEDAELLSDEQNVSIDLVSLPQKLRGLSLLVLQTVVVVNKGLVLLGNLSPDLWNQVLELLDLGKVDGANVNNPKFLHLGGVLVPDSQPILDLGDLGHHSIQLLVQILVLGVDLVIQGDQLLVEGVSFRLEMTKLHPQTVILIQFAQNLLFELVNICSAHLEILNMLTIKVVELYQKLKPVSVCLPWDWNPALVKAYLELAKSISLSLIPLR